MLIIGKVWPEPDSSAAGSRMMNLIRIFTDHGWKVEFASAASESDFSVDLSSMDIPSHSIQMNDASFDAFIRTLNPGVVLFDRFMTEEQFGWRVAEQCPDAVRVLDTEDLHCLREGRRLALKAGRPFILADLNNEIAKREIASILRCDLSLIISEVEMRFLQDYFRVDPSLIEYLPFLVGPDNIANTNAFSERANFISIGNFLHEPNWDAVRYLKEQVWPLIRQKLPDAELHIYGAYPSEKVFHLHNEKEGFVVKGRAENAANVISKARVLVAPLRFGAGLKGKLLDAMINGTPSVTTSVGAEGMNADEQWPGAIEDDPINFAQACIDLYSNESKWNEARSYSKNLLVARFSFEQRVPMLIERLGQIEKNLKEHRSNNFTGSMLLHHTLASTRFMSKWIEEKNKVR